MSYQCCCSFVVSVFSGSISPQFFNQFDSVWKPIKLTCSSFTSVDVVRITWFSWYIWCRYKQFYASVTESTLGNCTALSNLVFRTDSVKICDFFFFYLGRMSRAATTRFSVLGKYVVHQMRYCSHLWNDLVAAYALFVPCLRSKLLILFLTDAASCNYTLVAFPAGKLKLFSAVFLVQSLINVKWSLEIVLCVSIWHMLE